MPSISSSVKEHGLGGALGGFMACITLQPLDVIKTRLQQQNSDLYSQKASLHHENKINKPTFNHAHNKHSRIFSLVKSIVLHESPKALWRGTIATIYRNVPGSGLYFIILDKTRTFFKLTKIFNHKESMESLVAGSFSRAFVGFLFMPVSVLKVRFESNLYQYKSMFEAIRSIYMKEGLLGFFAGYGATALRDAPYAGLYVLFYDQLKNRFQTYIHQKKYRSDEKLEINTTSPSSSAYVNAGSGMIAGLLATSIVHPFDVLKTRIQLDPELYKNMWTAYKRIMKFEGMKGLFAGYVPRVTRRTLSAAITWTIYEEFMKTKQK